MSDVPLLQAHLESGDIPTENLGIHRLRGREAISRPYELEIELVCFDLAGIDCAAAAGAEVDLVVTLDGVEVRRFLGMIVEIDDLLLTRGGVRWYRARVVPRAYRLSFVETHEVFTGVSVPDLIRSKAGLVDLGPALVFRLTGTYPARDYVVQYGETDLAFVSRLAEHLGIAYFFEQQDGGEKLVFLDDNSGFHRIAEPLTFCPRGNEEDVYQLESRLRVIPGYYAVRDYNYRTPQLDLTASSEVPTGYAGGVVEYGTHHRTPEEGQWLAAVRAQERQAGQLVYHGTSNRADVAAGTLRTLTGHPDFASLDLLVTEVVHDLTQPLAQIDSTQKAGYKNTFQAIDPARPYRPARVTPKPRISGVHSGVIDAGGTPGSALSYLDAEGRYLVRLLFHSFAAGAAGAQAVSKPIRMAQPHAGAGYGMHFPLKPGVEVMVAFIGGDPDRPIIVGAVPNLLTPSPVSNRNAVVNRTKSQGGVLIDMGDE